MKGTRDQSSEMLLHYRCVCTLSIISSRELDELNTDVLGFDVVPEHQPVFESGQRSVTFTTMDFTTGG